MSALQDTSVSKLSYLTHALLDSTVLKELDTTHNPARLAQLVTEQVWLMRVSAHSALVGFTVRRLVVPLSLANVKEVGHSYTITKQFSDSYWLNVIVNGRLGETFWKTCNNQNVTSGGGEETETCTEILPMSF